MNSSNDIVINHEGGVFYFRYLQWDTEFFGKRSYVLDAAKSIFKPGAEIRELIIHSLMDSFVTVKLNTDIGIGTISFLEDCGFYYVDTEVRLRYAKSCRGDQTYDIGSVTIERPQHISGLPCELLGRAFTHTRFHTDSHISGQTADQLWISYLKNYQPSPNGHLFTAKTGDDVAGIIVVNTDGVEATFFYVSVIDKFRNRGIGSMLINKAAACFTGYNIFTGTQIKNTASLNFYIKNGFTEIDSTKTVLHYWGAARSAISF
ncbi:MAG: GNAT family N-acetyltransferase [Nitrospirae bacterium]|nr:GNAT family N-acetyltransferase [Nitrospirota bacterium]